MTEQNAYEGFAVVELMGRSVIAGYISEQTIAGVAMLRVDVPKVGDQEPFTKFFSGGAIYGITPTTQEIAERAAQRLRSRPVSEYVVSTPSRQPALIDSTAGDDDGDDGDDYGDDGDDYDGDDYGDDGDDYDGDDYGDDGDDYEDDEPQF